MAVKKGAKKSGRKAVKKPIRKQSTKKPVRKAGKLVKKPVRKKGKPARKVTVVRARPVAKAVKKDLKILKTTSKKTVKKATSHDRQLSLLRKEIEVLKKRKRTASLSDYNRFMRQQIKKGLSFKDAAKAWQRRKKELANKNKKRSAYNIFVSMQLKQGKTMKQAIAAWNALKKPKRAAKKRPAKKVGSRPKKRPAKKARKPAKKARKPVKKKPTKKANPRKPALPEIKISKIVDGVISGITLGQEMRLKAVKKLASATKLPSVQEGLSQEEIALRMLDVYFTEVARYGLKRKLSLDEVINAYFYALLRVQRKGIELEEIKKAALRD